MFSRSLILSLITILLLSCSGEDNSEISSTQTNDRYKPGVHYEIIDNPTTVRDSSKVEVIEVFWFGCNHCYALEPYLARWKRDIPQGVNFSKSPATWNEVLKTHARMYYTAKALGIEQQFIPAAFNTIQNEGRSLTGNTELEYFFSFSIRKFTTSKRPSVPTALEAPTLYFPFTMITGTPVMPHCFILLSA